MKSKKTISRQTANKIKFFGYTFIFVASSLSLIFDPKIDNGSLSSVLEGVIEILLCLLYLVALVLILLDLYMQNSPKVEKKDELYIRNEQFSDSLAIRIVMILLIAASCFLHSANVSVNGDTLFLAYSVVGLISSGSMLVLERSIKSADSDEDEE